MEEKRPTRRRSVQFSLRKLLLWVTVVAIGLSVLSLLELSVTGRVLLPVWLIAVWILRWGYGSDWAFALSMGMGMPFAQLLCSIWMTDDWSLKHSFLEGCLGMLIGYVLFLLVEAACRLVNWIDRIGQSKG